MSKAYLERLKRLNRELAQKDAANRCTLCKRNLNEVPKFFQSFYGRFCSMECLEQYRTRAGGR